MFKNTRVCCVVLFWGLVSLIFPAADAEACDSCGCALARSGGRAIQGLAIQEAIQRPWSFDFMVEQQNWNEMSAKDAHALHHKGHHVHDKTHEEFYHFALSREIGDAWTLRAEIPYVVRQSIEIDDHHHLGELQTSEGLGDLRLTGTWRFAQNASGFLGALGGVKLPTGSTTEKNTQGARFEPELQPGSGSVDGIFGAAYGWTAGIWTVEGNALYTIRTEGDQDFEFGDAFSSYTAVHLPLGRQDGVWSVRAGADFNLQVEARQKDGGVKMPDSGGTTLLAGPALTIRSREGFELIGNFLLPAVQDLGGVHQELDFAWNLGARMSY